MSKKVMDHIGAQQEGNVAHQVENETSPHHSAFHQRTNEVYQRIRQSESSDIKSV